MEGDQVWLSVSPLNGVIKFEKKGKVNPKFIGLFEILDRVEEVAYKLAFPPSLSSIHSVFHVSMLQSYNLDESHVISHYSVELSPDLTYEEKHVSIFDRHVRKLGTKELALVKVQWWHHSVGEAIWELQSEMRTC
ncbi:uncharacterized protein LOC129869747 [Solanum dulcamara]|uniref:uncharacterized protein LOC129869747 n=1 Tax=Solanum dulcamara TaxID=45834 RepID=UPI002484D9FF|nr:uncharacterized protein LOC129869747 [Solanum dulcamara]